jgi:hypothetical protein
LKILRPRKSSGKIDVRAERRIGGLELPLAPHSAFRQIVKLLRRANREQMKIRLEHFRRQFFERAYVVQNINGAPVRADYKVTLARVNNDVIDGDGRQSGHKFSPLPAAIKRNVKPNSVPANSKFLLTGSSRMTLTGAFCGRFATMERHVLP